MNCVLKGIQQWSQDSNTGPSILNHYISLLLSVELHVVHMAQKATHCSTICNRKKLEPSTGKLLNELQVFPTLSTSAKLPSATNLQKCLKYIIFFFFFFFFYFRCQWLCLSYLSALGGLLSVVSTRHGSCFVHQFSFSSLLFPVSSSLSMHLLHRLQLVCSYKSWIVVCMHILMHTKELCYISCCDFYFIHLAIYFQDLSKSLCILISLLLVLMHVLQGEQQHSLTSTSVMVDACTGAISRQQKQHPAELSHTCLLLDPLSVPLDSTHRNRTVGSHRVGENLLYNN